MWYRPTLVECKLCKRQLTQDEFNYSETLNKYSLKCNDCENKLNREKKDSKKVYVNYVKVPWKDALIPISETEKVKGSKIRQEHLLYLMNNGYDFVLKSSAIEIFYKNNEKK